MRTARTASSKCSEVGLAEEPEVSPVMRPMANRSSLGMLF